MKFELMCLKLNNGEVFGVEKKRKAVETCEGWRLFYPPPKESFGPDYAALVDPPFEK